MSFRQARSLAALVLCALPIACGDGGGEPREQSTAKAGEESSAKVSLIRPVYPRCGVEGFPKPRVQSDVIAKRNAQYWTLSYVLSQAPTKTAPNAILIVEFAPQLPRRTPRDLPRIRIGNRVVFFRLPDRKIPTYTAQLKTSRARYVIIADGRDTGWVKRLVSCLP